ncbi:MAG: radical SAM protein [Proteobacteria bacterium]|nr:radical SAM protein [Pseudomonadota bacterium]
MSFCSNEVTNFEFPPEDIEKVRKSGGLLSMEIEFSLRCNFNCPYCYVGTESDFANELSEEEIKRTIQQAKDLGARKIIILGGEPMIYAKTLEMIQYMRDLDLEVEMFTNGSRITAKVAQQLFRNGVRVVLKMNTFKADLQNKLSGTHNAHRIIHTAFDNLKKAGYPSENAVLAISTIICQQNFSELPDFWTWLRDRNILPYFEMITPQENALDNDWLYVEPDKVFKLFQQLSDIDRSKYGIEWDPQPPLVGNKCLRHQFSCLVNSQGDVLPCVGVTLSIGNVRQKSLGKILQESEVMRNLKNYKETIKGECAACEKSEYCYGCRGTAYQLTGDYLASDPLCWKNHKCHTKPAGASPNTSRCIKNNPKSSVA